MQNKNSDPFRTALFLLACLAPTAHAADAPPPDQTIFPRPTLVPIPKSVPGIAQPLLPVGNWRSKPAPQGDFWANGLDLSTWNPATGGGRGGGGGGAAAAGNEFTSAYRTTITIPADWASKRIVLRFDSVGDGAKLWVNGVPIRDHWGPLMPWSADITAQVKPGEDAAITLGIDERREGLNQFVRAGGLQGALLMALPTDYLSRLHAETTFDKDYKNATLHVWLTMAFGDATNAKIKLTLKDPAGKALDPTIVDLTPKTADHIFDIPVPSAIKWDAEHPNLYTLQADVLDANSAPTQTLSRQIGLRQVELRGNQLFVNGLEVKFRGIWGMNSVQQLKDLNANHTRQKWVTEQFLNEADRLGLYVLDENPVDFARYGVEADPKYAYQWLNFTADMIERDRSHPSVIMWGLGNESMSGPNTLKMFKYARIEDTQRPTMYSWANRVPTDQELPYSIASSHYPNMADPNMSLADFTVAKWHSESLPTLRNPRPIMPVLHDEYSHVVQNRTLLDRDPNVRAFWGESLYRYWEKMFITQGALGGDIFGLSGGFGGGNNESFLTRKAYSPIRIANQPLPNPGTGNTLPVPIKNWFDHTNLSEIRVDWAVGTESGSIKGPDLAPHATGTLTLPARAWKDNDRVSLKFYQSTAFMVDDFLLAINPPAAKLPIPQGPAPKLEQANGKITITGEHFKVVFNQYKGLIDNASYDGKTVFIDGPFLDLLGSGLAYGEWLCDKIDSHIDNKTNEAVIDIKGNYAIIKASFQVRIDGQGLMTTKYTLDFIPGVPPPSTFSPWDATSVGGYSEVGVSYMMPNSTNALTWKRKGLWSVYPPNHIGRNEGTAQKGADDFRSTKEYLLEGIVNAGTGASATALSDGRDSLRLYQDGGARAQPAGIRMGIHNEWNYPDIGIGNYAKPPINTKAGYTNTVYLKLGPAN